MPTFLEQYGEKEADRAKRTRIMKWAAGLIVFGGFIYIVKLAYPALRSFF